MCRELDDVPHRKRIKMLMLVSEFPGAFSDHLLLLSEKTREDRITRKLQKDESFQSPEIQALFRIFWVLGFLAPVSLYPYIHACIYIYIFV